MSKKNTNATIADLGNANWVLKKVQERDSHLRFGKIGESEELIVMGIGDASFKTEAKAVGVFLSCSCQTRRWLEPHQYSGSQNRSKVCHSPNDVETLNILKMVYDAIYTAQQVEILLFGEDKKRIKVCLCPDQSRLWNPSPLCNRCRGWHYRWWLWISNKD